MQDDLSLRRPDDEGVDVTADSPLPDVPDAGDDSQPIAPPEPVDISTATLTTDAALVANTFGDPRTLYEQALDAYEESDEGGGAARAVVSATSDLADASQPSGRRVRIYDA
jgi:hypothetical protein